jgi:hypothetical protein
MADTQRRAQLAELVERRRQELSQRPDISQRMRKLSESGGRHPKNPLKLRRSPTLTLLIGAVAVAGMLLCVGSAATVLLGSLWVQGQLGDPSITVQNYYSALKQKNYVQAYSYLSKKAQGQTSLDAFSGTYGSYDRVDGVIDQHIVTASKVGSDTATVTVTIVRRGRDRAQQQSVQLVKDGSDWRIDALTTTGDVPIPTTTP